MKTIPKASKRAKNIKDSIFIDWVNAYGRLRLAKKLDIDPSTISHWRNGTHPKVEHMKRIVEISEGVVTYGHIIDGGRP